MEEEIKKITKHYCGECHEELERVGAEMDVFSFLNPVQMRYCPNNKCERYGVVTVASIPE